MHAEMVAVVGIAAETNALVTALGVPVDAEFLVAWVGRADA
jgi:hypothetical protein